MTRRFRLPGDRSRVHRRHREAQRRTLLSVSPRLQLTAECPERKRTDEDNDLQATGWTL